MNRVNHLSWAAILFVLLPLSFAHAAENSTCEEFEIPNSTKLKLCTPLSWLSNIGQPPNGLPPTIAIRPKAANDPYIKITVFWNINNSNNFNNISDIRKTVVKTGNDFLPGAVEKTLPLKAMNNGKGYYFSITDKAAKPDDYKYMSQGIMALGKQQLIFTILTNSPDLHAFGTALSVIEKAEQI